MSNLNHTLSVNDLTGEGEVMIPTDDAPSYLKLKFNGKAYRMMEKMTGISHFARMLAGKVEYLKGIMSVEFVTAAIYAGSRKHHPDITLEAIAGALDDLSHVQLQDVVNQVVVLWTASMRGPEEVKPQSPLDHPKELPKETALSPSSVGTGS